jgi:hypothetical protein
MKKFSIFALLACALFTTSCESDSTLDETRVADGTAPTVAFEVSVNKYDATFNMTTNDGTPSAREFGIMVSTEAQPTAANSIVLPAEESNTITYGFNPGTTYYACAYALTANKLVTSDIKSFTTDSHPLAAFLGKKTLSSYNLLLEDEVSIPVTLTNDPNDETVAYLNGLASNQVSMALGAVKLVFDLENNTVTIPNGQVVAESKYGDYRYVKLSPAGQGQAGDIVGAIVDGAIQFETLGAMIVAGSNGGLFHWVCAEIEIK